MVASVMLSVVAAADVPIDEEQMLICYFQACYRSLIFVSKHNGIET